MEGIWSMAVKFRAGHGSSAVMSLLQLEERRDSVAYSVNCTQTLSARRLCEETTFNLERGYHYSQFYVGGITDWSVKHLRLGNNNSKDCRVEITCENYRVYSLFYSVGFSIPSSNGACAVVSSSTASPSPSSACSSVYKKRGTV